MPDTTKKKLENIATAIIALAAAVGLFHGFFVLPDRMDANDKLVVSIQKKIEDSERDGSKDHDLLVRIDERLKEVQTKLDKK